MQASFSLQLAIPFAGISGAIVLLLVLIEKLPCIVSNRERPLVFDAPSPSLQEAFLLQRYLEFLLPMT